VALVQPVNRYKLGDVMKKTIALILISLCLMAGKLSAASAPIDCSGFTLNGKSCVVSGSAAGPNGTRMTSNPNNNGFLISPVGQQGYNYVTKFEGDDTIWSSQGGVTTITLPESISSEFSQIAMGIFQASKWAVFMIDTALGSYEFNQNGISNITFYSAEKLTETPLPAAAWLFLTGLAGMGWLRKRKTKREALAAA
jgi:hypothetical protein